MMARTLAEYQTGSGDAGIAFVLSTPGQNILLKYGFLPLS